MITNKVDLLDITEKLKYVKNCPLSEQSFYFYIWNGIQKGIMFPYASYKNKKMTGCMVLLLTNDLKPGYILNLIFIWIDKKYKNLWKNYLMFTFKEAKRLGANRIQINTSRNPKVIKRRLGKYGFKIKYNVFEKVIKNV